MFKGGLCLQQTQKVSSKNNGGNYIIEIRRRPTRIEVKSKSRRTSRSLPPFDGTVRELVLAAYPKKRITKGVGKINPPLIRSRPFIIELQ